MQRGIWVRTGSLTCAALLWAAGVLAQSGIAPEGNAGTAAGVQSSAKGAADAPQEARQPSAGSTLAGTEWRLVEIQSMDDAIGITRPDDPSRYIMRLMRDGTVSLRLNCNSASGTWSAENGPGESSGRFEFGPLAAAPAQFSFAWAGPSAQTPARRTDISSSAPPRKKILT